MKKIIHLVTIFSLLVIGPSIVLAGTSGCGIGTDLWKGKKGVVPHVSANITNTLLGRTFSVTSGTSGCEGAETEIVQNEREIRLFLAANHEFVAEEMSQGQGEYLVTYANLLGCNQNSFDRFNQLTQRHYGEIFASPDSTASIIDQTRLVLKNDTQLNQSCSHL